MPVINPSLLQTMKICIRFCSGHFHFVWETSDIHSSAFALLALVLFISLNVEEFSVWLYTEFYIPYTMCKRE